MHLNGRPLDNPIPQEELLYFRCQKDWILDARDSLKPAKIPFPDQSVNRKKYSKPKDVLLPDDNDEKSVNYIYWGVAIIATKQIPSDFDISESFLTLSSNQSLGLFKVVTGVNWISLLTENVLGHKDAFL